MHQSASYAFNRYPLGSFPRQVKMAEALFWTNLDHISSASTFKLLPVPEDINLFPEIKKYQVDKCFAPGVD